MADLTMAASLKTRYPNQQMKETWTVNSSVAQTIYKGQPMIIAVAVDPVHLTPFVDATVVAPTDVFVGIAEHNYSVPLGAVETLTELILITHGEVGFKSAVFTDADVGKKVYMSDSATLSITAADNPEIGFLRRVLDGYAYVMINPTGAPTICAGA